MPKSKSNIVSSYSFLLIAHYATFAYQDILFDYLVNNKVLIVTKLNIPLPELPLLKRIEITESREGKIVYTKKVLSISSPAILAYIIQSIQVFFLVLLSKNKYEIVIAQDRLLALIAISLRIVGKCKTVIFYSHGVDRSRFKYRFVNRIYDLLDKISAINSNFNWFLNREMAKFRKNQGIDPNKLFWVPSSISIKTIKRKTNTFNHKVVFLGVLNKKNGAHVLPKIIFEVKEKIPDITLDIIGNGELYEFIKKKIKKLKLERNINLLGVLKFNDFSKFLTNYSAGIAPYEDVFDTLTATSDSMKMRVYLAAGLPVVITKGFIFSNEIEENSLGLAVSFNTEKFATSLINLLKNPNVNKEIRRKALSYSKKYDIITIYDKTFSKILETN